MDMLGVFIRYFFYKRWVR